VVVVVEVVAMPLGRIQAAARRSDDLRHSQHFLGRSLDHQRRLAAVDRRSICCSRRRETDAQASGFAGAGLQCIGIPPKPCVLFYQQILQFIDVFSRTLLCLVYCFIICSGVFPYLNKTAESDVVFSKVSFLVVFAGNEIGEIYHDNFYGKEGLRAKDGHEEVSEEEKREPHAARLISPLCE
jgi:hypothetical protein